MKAVAHNANSVNLLERAHSLLLRSMTKIGGSAGSQIALPELKLAH
jgi:hypothetical protein